MSGLLLWAAPASTATVPPIPGLPDSVLPIMNAAPFAHGTWAVSVSDATTGASLVDYNSDTMFEPASVTKTLSSAGAWLQFGPDSRIVTPVVRKGQITGGTLRGDLVLIAKGDITMGGQTAPDGSVIFADLDHNDANAVPGATLAKNNPLAGLDALARQVRQSGIRTVGGDVVIDDRLFITQDLGDNGPVSPIDINHNLIDVLVSPTSSGKPASIRTRALVTPWTVTNQVRTVRAGGPSDISIAAVGPRITVAGTIAADAAPILRVWQVADPAAFARAHFIEALGRAGVKVTAEAAGPNPVVRLGTRASVNALPVVARLRSLPFAEQATYVLKVSYNRGAQTFICLLAVSAGKRDCDAGFPVLATKLAPLGVDTLSIAQIDGSGLPGNFATPSAIVDLMHGFAQRPDWPRWRAAMPIMGVDGSVAMVQKGSPAAGHVFAKTGTLVDGDLLNGRLRLATKALGGYVQAKSGRWLAIAIFANQAVYPDIYGLFAANEDLGKIATAIWESY